MWVRFREGLPEDPMAHLAAFTYASDISLLGASLAVHDVNPAKALMASLDHTLWFHRPFRADEWWLYDQWSPSRARRPGPGVRSRLHRPTALWSRPPPRRA